MVENVFSTVFYTGADGSYTIPPVYLPPGNYLVNESGAPGWRQTFPASRFYAIAVGGSAGAHSGITIADRNFGNKRDNDVTLISGRKFFDANANGIADPAEWGLRYWPIYIDSNRNGLYESGEPITWTDWNGVYGFSGVPAGIYRIRELQQPGWTQTTPDPTDIVVTANGQTFDNVNFGNQGVVGLPGGPPAGGPGTGGSGSPTDLEITKNAPLAVAGESVTYTLRVTNKGPADAYGVILGDQLPAGLVYESATPSQGVCFGNQTIICAVGPLAVRQSATVTIVAHVLSWVQDEIKNEACVYSTSSENNPADNCAVARTAITSVADLQLVKTADTLVATAGRNLTYTLRVHNDGPSDSTNVSVEDELPPEVTFVSAESQRGTCSATTTSVTTVSCDLGTVANGETVVMTIVVRVLEQVTEGTMIINRGSVRSAHDPNAGNNGSISFVSCGRASDLQLTKRGPFPVVDAQVYYVLEVTNHGPSNSSGTFVGDHLPAGINFLSAVPSKGSCNFNAGTNVLICGLGPMLVNEMATVTVYVGVPTTVRIADIRNEGIVWGLEGDPAPWNNTGGTGGVPVRSHIGIIKDAPATVIAGETLTYTLHVTNEGPDNSSNVIVGDTLPPNVGLISVTTTRGSCYASNPILCFLGALRVGESADVRITVSVPSSLPADVILSNTAFGFGGLDPLPWPGYGHVNTRVTRAADLELEKDHRSRFRYRWQGDDVFSETEE